MGRRRIAALLAALTIATSAIATRNYMTAEDQPMNLAPQIEGEVLCDLHAHPPKNLSDEDLIDMLTSPGLVGLARASSDSNVLSYEGALTLLAKHNIPYKEISPGQLCKVGDGYFVRAEEVFTPKFHFLALNFTGNYLPSFETTTEALEAIVSKGGRATTLNHGYSIPTDSAYRLAREDEYSEVEEVAKDPRIRAIEVHNAMNIDYVPLIWPMRTSNRLATQLAQRVGKPGTSASDAKRELPPKIAGIYISKYTIEKEGIQGLVGAIEKGNFRRLGDAEEGPYYSRESFTRNMAVPRMISICPGPMKQLCGSAITYIF